MHLTDLQYFQTIARYGNITTAARMLGMRQPTLTVAMHRLEAEIGTTLFLRDRSGVTLTDTGKAFLQYVSAALSLLDVGKQYVQGLETDDMGSFILGVPSALGSYFLPSFFPDFLRQAPRIEVSLWTGTGQAVYQAVLTRDVHFGLVVNPTPHPELVLTQLFHDATDFFVASPSEDMAPPVNPRDTDSRSIHWDTVCAQLRTGPLVYVSCMSQAHVLRERLGAEQLLPAQQLRCGELEVVKSLALAGVGVAILPRRVAASDPLKRLHRLHPDLPFIHDAVYLIHRADLHHTQAVVRLKDALVAHGQRLGSDAESQCIQQEIVRQTHKMP
jgi:DNA-binding transcriptional LysR family regulator